MRQQLELYDMYQRQMGDCDTEVRKVMERMDSKADPETEVAPRKGRKSHGHRAPVFDLREPMFRVSGWT